MSKRLVSLLLFTGLSIGILLAWQFNSSVPTVSNFATDEVAAREELLKEFLDEQSILQSRIVSLRGDIEAQQENINTQSASVNLNTLDSLKQKIGLSEQFGTGLEIVLDDGHNAQRGDSEISDLDLVQASDIRDIVNILNAANADAVSVNGQRVVATSPISSVGTTILVNNSHVTPPFVVQAIGDTEIMLQRLLNEDLLPSIYDRVPKGQLLFEISVKQSMGIPVYNGELKTDLITLEEL